MTVENNIFIFANTYSCPLDKRCDNCVFDDLSKINKKELYKKIIDTDTKIKQSLVDECMQCQEEYESLHT